MSKHTKNRPTNSIRVRQRIQMKKRQESARRANRNANLFRWCWLKKGMRKERKQIKSGSGRTCGLELLEKGRNCKMISASAIKRGMRVKEKNRRQCRLKKAQNMKLWNANQKYFKDRNLIRKDLNGQASEHLNQQKRANQISKNNVKSFLKWKHTEIKTQFSLIEAKMQILCVCVWGTKRSESVMIEGKG